jgi:RNA 3'-terminal phosphate cyclase (ATP)
MPSRNKGTLLLLLAHFEFSQCCFFALGKLGKPAERVADEAVDYLFEFLETDGAVDTHLADQLLLPACLAEGLSEISTNRLTSHLETNAEIIQAFLPIRIEIQDQSGGAVTIRVIC